MEPRQKRVLMVAAVFPPTGGPGVQRSVKFAKYLPRFGWMPIIWAAEHGGDLPEDPTLLDGLPDSIRVHRTRRGLNGKHFLHHGHYSGRGLAARIARAAARRVRTSHARKPMPDDMAPWARASVAPLCRLLERQGVDAIYSTFSPASNHLLGLALKHKTGLPWAADFRDLWTDDYRYTEPSAQHRHAHLRLQREILEHADAVIGVTPSQTAILARHVPDHPEKFLTITNGYDPADFGDLQGESFTGLPEHREGELVWQAGGVSSTAAGSGRHSEGGHYTVGDHCNLQRRVRGDIDNSDRTFVLAHVGRFDRWRAGEALLEGLRNFIAKLGKQHNRFTIRVVGHLAAGLREKVDSLGARCEFTGYVSHKDAIREMRSATALLLGVPDGPNARSVIPAKLFEYLASARPILLIGPVDGECERIVRSAGAGLAVGFDPEAIAFSLEEMFKDWRCGKALTGCPANLLEPYNRITLTSALGAVLDRIAASGSAGRSLLDVSGEVCMP